MVEQPLPVGIDSEIEHVQSETDRVDAIFTVTTGPVVHQEVNYHIIDEERDLQVNQQPFSPITSTIESLIKSRLQGTGELFESRISHQSEEYHVSDNKIQHKASDNDDAKKARFSLPEIDSSNQQEKKYPIKKVNDISKRMQNDQFTTNQTTNIYAEEETSSIVWNDSTFDIPEHCRPYVNNTLRRRAETLLPFYTLNELAQHHNPTDAWICIFGHIYDITSLITKAQGTKVYQQLISYAGHDISIWFDEITHEPRRRIDPHTHQSVSVIKNLSLIEALGTPFWQTKDPVLGRLTKHPRYIRLRNHLLPNHLYTLEVAEEDTIGQIAIKFLKYNSHIFSYLWRYNGQILDMNKTLTENGIINEEYLHDRYAWRSDNEDCPTIILYYSDDLTIA